MDKKRVISVIESQIDKLRNIKKNFSTEIPVWRERTIRMLSDLIVPEELELLNNISSDDWVDEKINLGNFLVDLSREIESNPQHYLLFKEPIQLKKTNKGAKEVASNKVFVVHGHDGLIKTEVARTLEKLHLEAIILHEQPNAGKTIIEKFERDASQVDAAIIIMSDDDIGYQKNKPDEKKPRARQNVILELGYFSGILGRSKVCVLYKESVEIPSDFIGVVYILIDGEGSWKFKMAKELKHSGLAIDLNML